MSKKKYILSGRPAMKRPNESGCVQIKGSTFKPKSSVNTQTKKLKEVNLDDLPYVEMSSSERSLILARENANIRR